MAIDLELQQVHVLVTGASGGIGLETTKLFLEQGAKVTAHYNSNPSTLLSLHFLHSYTSSKADLTSETSVGSLFASAQSQFSSPVQVLVVNHGIWPPQDAFLWEMELEQWKNTMDVNVTSAFLVAKYFLKALAHVQEVKESVMDKVNIVFIGSSAGKYGEKGHADYAAGKSALMYGLTLTLKNEISRIAPKGRVNAIAPGWVKTSANEHALNDPNVVYRALATTPLKKIGNTYDIATQVVWLASSKVSGHVSGHVVDVNGGMEGRLLNMPEDI
ncbi:NAD-P-binding protein [Gymnopus androsaceus JB14]|uniref:NAD-P-binding protein n=1 Tax=Gymnopus androsaceus JB14 TaxID=1447944 RepID=A0A6A4I760_9AGAR|nr:NAD-P-binding protein [Gymnopus androsaceus JB14]